METLDLFRSVCSPFGSNFLEKTRTLSKILSFTGVVIISLRKPGKLDVRTVGMDTLGVCVN